MALLIFDAIYYDVTAKEIAALKPKAAFIPVFRQSPSFVETSDGMFSIGGSDGGRFCGSKSYRLILVTIDDSSNCLTTQLPLPLVAVFASQISSTSACRSVDTRNETRYTCFIRAHAETR
jgi:hypothetical protein